MTKIEARVRGDESWTPMLETVALAQIKSKMEGHGFQTSERDGVLKVISPITKKVEYEYREVN